MAPDPYAADLQRIAEIPDPLTRAREAAALREEYARTADALAEVRRNAVAQMHEGGMSWQKIADALGVSRPRAAQIAGGTWTHTLVATRQ